jgi:hypothetical protein
MEGKHIYKKVNLSKTPFMEGRKEMALPDQESLNKCQIEAQMDLIAHAQQRLLPVNKR